MYFRTPQHPAHDCLEAQSMSLEELSFLLSSIHEDLSKPRPQKVAETCRNHFKETQIDMD